MLLMMLRASRYSDTLLEVMFINFSFLALSLMKQDR